MTLSSDEVRRRLDALTQTAQRELGDEACPFLGTPTTYEVVPCVGPCGMRGDGPSCEHCDHNVAVRIVNRNTARRHLAAEGIVK